MILFAILLVALLAFAIFAVAVVIVGGGFVAVAFGDVIVCGLLIYIIVKYFVKRKEK